MTTHISTAVFNQYRKTYRAISGVIGLYGLCGILTIYLQDDIDIGQWIAMTLMFVIFPFYAAFALWMGNKLAACISWLYFMSQTIRYVGPDKILPNSYPISIVYPVTDFSSGFGYFIDFFSVTITLVLSFILLMSYRAPIKQKKGLN